MRECAPILFLVFNRPEETRRVFETIAMAKPKQLFVAADGPRASKTGETALCSRVRQIATNVTWDCQVQVLFRDCNLGCKRAVESAIDWFFEYVEYGVILEDDCLPSESFFRFCSYALERYKVDSRIMMVSGNNFLRNSSSEASSSYYFSRIYHMWGWATWRRAWRHYDPLMQQLSFGNDGDILDAIFPDENIALSHRLAFAFTRWKRVDTWDYPWVYSCLMQAGLSVVPTFNLVTNVGIGNGTHTCDPDSQYVDMRRFELKQIIEPTGVYCDEVRDLRERQESGMYPLAPSMSLRYRYRRWRSRRRLVKDLKKVVDQGGLDGGV